MKHRGRTVGRGLGERAPRAERAWRGRDIAARTSIAALLAAAATVAVAGCESEGAWLASPHVLLFPGQRHPVGVLGVRAISNEAGCEETRLAVTRGVDTPSGWQTALIGPIGVAPALNCDATVQWLRSDAGTEYVVSTGRGGAEIWAASAGSSWVRVTPAASLPPSVAGTLATRSAGHAWVGADGRARVHVGQLQLTLEGTAIVDQRVGPGCGASSLSLCTMTSETTGYRAYYVPGASFAMEAFDCTSGTCAIGPSRTLGSDGGGLGEPRTLFHTTTGIPVFVHRLWERGSGSEFHVVAGDTSQTLAPGGAYGYGGVALSDGGFAIAAATYAGEVILYVADARFAITQTTLQTGAMYPSAAVLAQVQPGGPDLLYVVAVRGFVARVFRLGADRRVESVEDLPLASQ